MKAVKKIFAPVMVVVIAAALLNIYVNNWLCGIAHAIDLSGVEHSHEFGHDHHGHEGHEQGADHEHKGDHSHNTNEESCCTDISSDLLSRSGKVFQVNLKLLKVSVEVISQAHQESLSIQALPGSSHYHWKAPPPGIPDIRVFIRSFII